MSKIATFTITLQNATGVITPAAKLSHVHYATVPTIVKNGTTYSAVDGTDYTGTSGVLAFNIGESTHTVQVAILADTTADVTKGFGMTMSTPDGYPLATATSGVCIISTASGVIVPPPTPSDAVVVISAASIVSGSSPAPLLELHALADANGARIVDSTAATMILKGINWYGFDGNDEIVHGLYAGRGYKDVLDQFSQLGFNTVRLPFADDIITSTNVFVSTSGDHFVDPTENPDIIGLTPLQALDAIIAYGASIGMRFVLDHHRISTTSIHAHNTADATNAGQLFVNVDNSTDLVPGMAVSAIITGLIDTGTTIDIISGGTIKLTKNTLAAIPTGTQISFGDSGYGTDGWPAADPTTGEYTYGGSTTPRPYTQATWQAMWTGLATHFTTGAYASDSNLANAVCGFDPHNEPRNLDWATWAAFVEPVAIATLDIAPKWLCFVEGVGKSADKSINYWDGGYLRDAATRPINLGAHQSKLVYSAHDYGQSVFGQTWLSTRAQNTGNTNPAYPVLIDQPVTGYPGNLAAVFSLNWGYLMEQKIAPVWVGEFGGGLGLMYTDGSADPLQTSGDLEVQWLDALVAYIGSIGASWAYFAYNPESGPPLGGLMQLHDYEEVQVPKMNALLPLVGQQ